MSINKTTKSKLNFLEGKKSLFKQHEFSSGNLVGTVLNAGDQKAHDSRENSAVSLIFSDHRTKIRKIRRGKYL